MKFRHALLMIGCVEVYALLRHHYSLAVACGLVLALVLKYFLCAWAVPVLAAHWFLLQYATLAIGINEFFHMAVVDWGLIMAAGVMVTIPALVFFVAVQRYLIAGWGAGGLKG